MFTKHLTFDPQMKVWEKNMGAISTPDNIPRLFDMVKVKDESVRPAFYFAMRDTLVAKDLEQATRVAFQKDRRWRVVTMQGQIIEMAGTGSVCLSGRLWIRDWGCCLSGRVWGVCVCVGERVCV